VSGSPPLPARRPRAARRAALPVLALVLTALAPAGALAAPPTLTQLSGRAGCVVDRSVHARGCTAVRGLRGAAPFQGSNAIALSPDGRHVYVAGARSDAVAVLRRDARSGRLTQARGAAGCIAAGGARRCAPARGLDWPNSVAVSPDGRNVYATANDSDSVAVFRRNRSTGALTQLGGARGCIAVGGGSGCATGRALDGVDVVAVSPDGRNVYAGAFSGNAVAVFRRDRSTGALTQLSGAAGCISSEASSGCTPGVALTAPEGLAVSGDGRSVYAASAVSGALDVFARDRSTGALTQATDGSGCIVTGNAAGCTVGRRLAGANAVAVSPDDRTVYVTSLLSNSVTAFARLRDGSLAQIAESFGCVVAARPDGCTQGRALAGPEGVAVAPRGAALYVTSFISGAVDVFARDRRSGGMTPVRGRGGCVSKSGRSGCAEGRRLRGVSSVAASPDGRHVYAAAFGSSAVAVFRAG